MLTFLLCFHFLLAILIIGLVLIQKHEADGVLGTGGSAGKVFSVRGQANLLSRSTAVLMTLFFLNCLVMAKLVKHSPRTRSLIDEAGDIASSTGSDRFGPFKNTSSGGKRGDATSDDNGDKTANSNVRNSGETNKETEGSRNLSRKN